MFASDAASCAALSIAMSCACVHCCQQHVLKAAILYAYAVDASCMCKCVHTCRHAINRASGRVYKNACMHGLALTYAHSLTHSLTHRCIRVYTQADGQTGKTTDRQTTHSPPSPPLPLSLSHSFTNTHTHTRAHTHTHECRAFLHSWWRSRYVCT